MAKPTKYCLEWEDYIAEKIGLGVPKSLIARSLGIPPTTLLTWLDRKRALRVKVAEKLTEETERRLKGAGDQFWLERIHREEFAPPKQEVKTEGQLIIQVVKHGDGSSDTS